VQVRVWQLWFSKKNQSRSYLNHLVVDFNTVLYLVVRVEFLHARPKNNPAITVVAFAQKAGLQPKGLGFQSSRNDVCVSVIRQTGLVSERDRAGTLRFVRQPHLKSSTSERHAAVLRQAGIFYAVCILLLIYVLSLFH
jgi:hypothetical protein